MIRAALLISVLVLVSCTGQVPQSDHAQRQCTSRLEMPIKACSYELSEVETYKGESVGVHLVGHLGRVGNRLALIENRDGSGAMVYLGEMLDKYQQPGDLDEMVGRRVGVFGTYQPLEQAVDVYAIGWLNDPASSPSASAED